MFIGRRCGDGDLRDAPAVTDASARNILAAFQLLTCQRKMRRTASRSKLPRVEECSEATRPVKRLGSQDPDSRDEIDGFAAKTGS